MKSISVFLIALLFMMACKKKDNNNPSINDRTINKTINAYNVGNQTGISDHLDLDDDGKIDIDFFGELSDSVKFILIKGANDSTNILTEIVSYVAPSGAISVSKPMAANTMVDVSSSYWTYNGYASIISTKVNKEINVGIHGDGDTYLAFQIQKNTGNDYYGWMLLNISSDLKTIIIKEVAVNTVANKGINVGEK